MKPSMDFPQILALICAAHEFANIRVREEELGDLDDLRDRAHLPVQHLINSLIWPML